MYTDDFTKNIFKMEKKVQQLSSMVLGRNQTILDIEKLVADLGSYKHISREKIAQLEEEILIAKKCQTFDARILVLENFARNEVLLRD